MDKNKLLYFIKDRGYKVEEFLELIKMSKAAFYRRLKDENFSIQEIWKIKDSLELTLDDINSIFFAKYVS